MEVPLKRGFKVVSRELANQEEVVLNRGSASRSNFFIFVNFRKRRLCFWHPGKGLRFKTFRDAKELSERLEEVDDSEIKNPNDYFLHLHGHWKSKHDDGASGAKTVIRDLMLHHVDFDLSGFHNGIIESELKDIGRLEALANITKGISTEVSLPLPSRKGLLRNGPHVKVWVRDAETGREMEERFLSNRHHNDTYRAFSSDFNVEEFLGWMESKDERVSIGTPHPFFGFEFMGKLRATGILHFLERWRSIVNFILAKSDGVAAMNSDCRDKLVVPSNSTVENMLRRLTGSSVIREEVADMRFSEAHSAEHGSFAYFEPDSHINPMVNYSKDHSLLGEGVNVVSCERRPSYEEVFRALKERKVQTMLFPSTPSIVRVMMSAQVVALHTYLIAKQLL